MDEFDVAERVVRERSLPSRPAALARGQSWPVAWHRSGRCAAVLFVEHSARVPRWRRSQFDLLLAELAAEDGSAFTCDSVGAIGPGSLGDPFAPPPAVSDGLVDGGTAERVEISDDGEPTRRHVLAWGRAGSGTSAVELRTVLESVRVPVVETVGYFVMVAIGSDPELVLHATSDDAGTTL
jgi:hypothetical protein